MPPKGYKKPVADAAAPVKKTVAKRATQPRSRAAQAAASSTPTTDPMYAKLQALSFARSLFPEATIGADGTVAPVVSGSKLVTQAKAVERYLLGVESTDEG